MLTYAIYIFAIFISHSALTGDYELYIRKRGLTFSKTLTLVWVAHGL